MKQSARNEEEYIGQSICLKPVGIVRNQIQEIDWRDYGSSSWHSRTVLMKKQLEAVSELIINSDLDGALDGIEGFSHINVIYWAHLIPAERRSLTRVYPMGRTDLPLTGVFTTHSPARPNSILITTVRLIERKGNVLIVTGLDALDGSPILDIKPYLPDEKSLGEIKMPDWMRQIHQEFEDK